MGALRKLLPMWGFLIVCWRLTSVSTLWRIRHTYRPESINAPSYGCLNNYSIKRFLHENPLEPGSYRKHKIAFQAVKVLGIFVYAFI